MSRSRALFERRAGGGNHSSSEDDDDKLFVPADTSELKDANGNLNLKGNETEGQEEEEEEEEGEKEEEEMLSQPPPAASANVVKNEEEDDDDDDIRIEEIVLLTPKNTNKNGEGKGRKRPAESSGASSESAASFSSSSNEGGGRGKRSKNVTKEFLLCAACKLLSIPPSSSCPGGHLICAICMDNEKVVVNGKCPVPRCSSSRAEAAAAERSPSTPKRRGRPVAVPELIRNAFADAILMQNVPQLLACRNKERLGCGVKLPLNEMREHLEHCKRKIMRCFVSQPANCGGRVFPEDKFLDHLVVFHESKDLRFGNSKVSDPVIKHVSLLTQAEVSGSEKVVMNVEFFQYKKDIFFFNCLKEGNCLNWWITFLGSEEDAIKYRYSLSIRLDDSDADGNATTPEGMCGRTCPQRRIVMDDLFVHAMDIHTLDGIMKTGDFLGVNVACLQSFKLDASEESREIAHDVKINMEIRFKEEK